MMVYNPEQSAGNLGQEGFQAKRILETIEARKLEAQNFINSLKRKPKYWKLSGSSARGDFRPDSDLDIEAIYEKEEDIPYDEMTSRMDPDNDLIDGFIDFHYFAEDWAVFKSNPKMLKEFKSDLG